MGKNKDLQPWLDYFAMLRTFELKGFLEVKPDSHEAFVTQAALLVLLGMDEAALAEYLADQKWLTAAATDLLQRIRGYAGFKSLQGKVYLEANFALHIVKDDQPHDLLCTILLTNEKHVEVVVV